MAKATKSLPSPKRLRAGRRFVYRQKVRVKEFGDEQRYRTAIRLPAGRQGHRHR